MNKIFFYAKELILLSPIKFILITLFLIIEIFILGLSVISIIPLGDYILDKDLSNPSKYTKIIINFLDYFSIKYSFFLFATFFCILQIFKGFISVLINYYILKFKYEIIKKINNQTLDLLLNIQWDFFSKMNLGYLTNSFLREINKIGDTVGNFAKSLAAISQVLVYLSLPIYLNWKISLSIIFLIIFFVVPFLKFSTKLSYMYGKDNTQTSNHMMTSLMEILQSLKYILINNREIFFKNNYLNKFESHVKATIKAQVLATAANAFFQPIGIISILIVFGFFFNNKIPFSEIIAIFYSMISVVSSVNKILGLNINIANLAPSFDQIISIQEQAKLYQVINGKIKFSNFKNLIEFKNVSFSYNKDSEVIKNINLKIYRNKITAIIGQSGSGKSTLLDLLVGLIKPTKGNIFIDNQNIINLEKKSYRERISYVSQDLTLFDASIKQNLTCVSSKNFSLDDIYSALHFANLKSFVDSLPYGLDTKIGEKGVQLSGGQRQRLSLARAFLKKAEIYLFDEATSSLDSLNENDIHKAILKLKEQYNLTIIIVAHRLSTIKNSDYVLVLNDGMIAEFGSFNDLGKINNSLFQKLLASQIIKE
jgi:ABC-type bacteriocin/lantibiotic exporter with double-glycine peptidase domain